MRYAVLALAVCGVTLLATVSDARAAKPLGTADPRHSCAACRGLPQCVRQWCPTVAHYWRKYSLKLRHRQPTNAEIRKALTIMYRESRGQPYARNGVFCGLFQIWTLHFNGRPPFTPVSNIATAAMLWARSGWQPWTCTAW